MNNPSSTTHIGNQVSRIRRSSTQSFLKAVQDLDPVSHDRVMTTIVSLYPVFAAPEAPVVEGHNN